MEVGSEQQFLTAFRVDPVDPVDPLENSRKHDFAAIYHDFGTFARKMKFKSDKNAAFRAPAGPIGR